MTPSRFVAGIAARRRRPIQAASVLVIPLATALLALRLQGWRAMTLLVASGTAWFGVVRIVHPDHLGSWGATWGWTGVA